VQVAYSLGLKHQVILDVFVIAAGFVLRAASGAVAIGAPISPWLYVCTLLLALFLGLAKRRAELMLLNEAAGRHRRVLEEYSATLLEEMISVVTSATVIAYAVYTFSAPTLPQNHAMMLTIPFVLYAVFRYLYLVYRKNEGGSPEHLLLSDRPLLACVVLWGLASAAILYYPWS
jgi:4-hydroxybenzoate polyprenyltransferase